MNFFLQNYIFDKNTKEDPFYAILMQYVHFLCRWLPSSRAALPATLLPGLVQAAMRRSNVERDEDSASPGQIRLPIRKPHVPWRAARGIPRLLRQSV